MQDIDFYRLSQIEAEWEEIESSYRLAPYEAPTNVPAEREKLFDAYSDGRVYDPQFEYLVPPEFPERQIRQFMAKLEPEQSVFEHMYYEKARNELLGIECVQQHEPRTITGLSCLMYGLPDQALVQEAQRILSEPPITNDSRQTGVVSAESAAAAIQSVLDSVGLDRWRAVVYEPMLAKMAVHRLDKEVRIRAGATFDPEGVRRLIVHEIGVHVLRHENGSRQPIKLFANGFTDYLETEEGLAVYCEAKGGLLENATVRRYAGRVVAAHLAVNHSFGEVFRVLAFQLDQRMAFDIVARAKRCFKDTSQLGAHTKDIVYLSGFLQVSSHQDRYPEDYDLLFAGKFGLRHLQMIQMLIKQGVVTQPKLLPGDLFTSPIYDYLEVN